MHYRWHRSSFGQNVGADLYLYCVVDPPAFEGDNPVGIHLGGFRHNPELALWGVGLAVDAGRALQPNLVSHDGAFVYGGLFDTQNEAVEAIMKGARAFVDRLNGLDIPNYFLIKGEHHGK